MMLHKSAVAIVVNICPRKPNIDQPLIKDPILTEEADYVVIESTYGPPRLAHAGRGNDNLRRMVKVNCL